MQQPSPFMEWIITKMSEIGIIVVICFALAIIGSIGYVILKIVESQF